MSKRQFEGNNEGEPTQQKRVCVTSTSQVRKDVLKFPVDCVSDFKALRKGGFFFVDKSKYIKDVEARQAILLLLRPKRFGKSLFLSTLKYFYDIAEAQIFDDLFGPLAIYKHAAELQHSEFLILEWSFSNVEKGSNAETRKSLTNHINLSIEFFYLKYANLPNFQRSEIDKEDCIISIEHMVQSVAASPYPLYILIDEYDSISNSFLDAENTLSYQQRRRKQSFLTSIFSVVKDLCSKGISRVFMTGVSPLYINDIASEFSIHNDVTMFPEFEQVCGFTRADIRRGLRAVYSKTRESKSISMKSFVSKHLNTMSNSYYGHKFTSTSREGIYNSNMCLYYFQRLLMGDPQQMFDSNNELNANVLRFVGKNRHTSTLLPDLLQHKRTPFDEIKQDICVSDLVDDDDENDTSLKSLLFYLGALTMDDEPGYLRISNAVVEKTVIKRILQFCKITSSSNVIRRAICPLV